MCMAESGGKDGSASVDKISLQNHDGPSTEPGHPGVLSSL